MEETIETTAAPTVTPEVKYSADTIVNADKYRRYKDLLVMLLDEGKEYTEADVDGLINKALAQTVVKEINE